MAISNLQMNAGQNLSARERLIVALDLPDKAQALSLVEKLGGEVGFYKVGWRLFLSAGPVILDELRDRGKKVFLDLKINDIEETVSDAVRAVGDRVTFFTLQGGAATVRAATRARAKSEFPKFLFVTLLSSLGAEDVAEMLQMEVPPDVNEFIFARAHQAIGAGADGVIASGDSVQTLRERFGPKLLIVTPGIRPSGSDTDDHKRSLTPSEAIRSGADYLVIGRPIRSATDPLGAAKTILDEINGAASRA